MEGRLYHESQTIMPKMTAFVAALLCTGTVAFTMYASVGTGEIDLASASGIMLMATLAITLLLTFVLFILRINITVEYGLLTVGIFKGRRIPMNEIHSVAQENFSALKDYLGWGIKVGRKGLGYIAAGTNSGLRINLKEGRSFFISSKRTFEFESAMKTALRSIKE